MPLVRCSGKEGCLHSCLWPFILIHDTCKLTIDLQDSLFPPSLLDPSCAKVLNGFSSCSKCCNTTRSIKWIKQIDLHHQSCLVWLLIFQVSISLSLALFLSPFLLQTLQTIDFEKRNTVGAINYVCCQLLLSYSVCVQTCSITVKQSSQPGIGQSGSHSTISMLHDKVHAHTFPHKGNLQKPVNIESGNSGRRIKRWGGHNSKVCVEKKGGRFCVWERNLRETDTMAEVSACPPFVRTVVWNGAPLCWSVLVQPGELQTVAAVLICLLTVN